MKRKLYDHVRLLRNEGKACLFQYVSIFSIKLDVLCLAAWPPGALDLCLVPFHLRLRLRIFLLATPHRLDPSRTSNGPISATKKAPKGVPKPCRRCHPHHPGWRRRLPPPPPPRPSPPRPKVTPMGKPQAKTLHLKWKTLLNSTKNHLKDIKNTLSTP